MGSAEGLKVPKDLMVKLVGQGAVTRLSLARRIVKHIKKNAKSLVVAQEGRVVLVDPGVQVNLVLEMVGQEVVKLLKSVKHFVLSPRTLLSVGVVPEQVIFLTKVMVGLESPVSSRVVLDRVANLVVLGLVQVVNLDRVVIPPLENFPIKDRALIPDQLIKFQISLVFQIAHLQDLTSLILVRHNPLQVRFPSNLDSD
ncbi:MAG: hypothetical protein A3F33_01840 [Candidatus Woykebacteria bacterium RIFCSPHIGHO2_12_FULL_43_10]|nr:MAG: hypothetical protein A3F33_01840 [Candidatus Woykebacteria bacterium RIFCSPHIGHO2_12_FULL_43_10]